MSFFFISTVWTSWSKICGKCIPAQKCYQGSCWSRSWGEGWDLFLIISETMGPTAKRSKILKSLTKWAHTEVFGVLVLNNNTYVCLFFHAVHVNKHSRNSWNVAFKHLVIWKGDPVTIHEGWGKLEMPTCTTKYAKIFFLNIMLWFYKFYQDSTFMENFEEPFKNEEYSFPLYCIDWLSSNFCKKNKFWKKESFFFF